MEIRGRNLAEGGPNTLSISSLEVYEAMSGPLSSILQAIKNGLEQSPPELSSDISERGIVLTGGGALLRDLDVIYQSKQVFQLSRLMIPLLVLQEEGELPWK